MCAILFLFKLKDILISSARYIKKTLEIWWQDLRCSNLPWASWSASKLHVARLIWRVALKPRVRLAMPVGLNVVHSLVLSGSEMKQCCMEKNITSPKRHVEQRFYCE